jgi:hypothetical protein
MLFVKKKCTPIRRNGLKSALAGRDDSSLSIILTFLARNINDPSHSKIIIQVANTLLGNRFRFTSSVSIFQSLSYFYLQTYTRTAV